MRVEVLGGSPASEGGRGTWELPLGAGIGGLPAQRHPEVGRLLPLHHHLLLSPGDSVSNHLGHLPLIPTATLEKGGVAVLGGSTSSAPPPPPSTTFNGLELLGLRGSPGSRPCAHSPASLMLQRMAEETRETALPAPTFPGVQTPLCAGSCPPPGLPAH